jgi:hypothetical protein
MSELDVLSQIPERMCIQESMEPVGRKEVQQIMSTSKVQGILRRGAFIVQGV